ncbi:MAG: LysR family transcriptional regulator [Granulosicoccus sp.]
MDKNLKAFICVAEAENLSMAAHALGLTQPSITKRVHNLEAEVGSQLFERHRRGMTLTDTGKRFLLHAKRIEREFLQAREEIRSRENAGLDVLRIGAGPLFHLRYVATVFAMLNKEFPLLRLNLSTDTNEGNLPRLLAGELDIVLGVIDYPASDNGLCAYPMTTVEQGIILKHEAVGDKLMLTSDAIEGISWILYSDDKNNEDMLQRYFTDNSLGVPRIAVRTSSFTTGLHLVQSGGYAMIAPVQLSPIVNAAGLNVVSVHPPLAKRSAGAFIRRSSMGFTAITRFLAILEKQISGIENESRTTGNVTTRHVD